MAANSLRLVISTTPIAALPEEVGVTAPVGVPVLEASLEAMDEAAEAAASGLLAVFRRTESMR